MSESDRYFKANPLTELMHLDEEDIALAAEGTVTANILEHLESCEECQERVSMAKALFCVEPLRSARSRKREEELLELLTDSGALPPASSKLGLLRVVLEDGSVRVLETNAEVRIQRRAVATRRLDAEGESSSVAFFRRFGDVEMEIHLVRVPTGRFHLVVGLMGGGESSHLRVGLHCRGRQLGLEPARLGAVTFKNLRPGSYRVEVQERGVSLGQMEVDVEGRYSSEGEL